jgi:hypothetical protein
LILPNGKRQDLCQSLDCGFPRGGGNQYPLLFTLEFDLGLQGVDVSTDAVCGRSETEAQTAKVFFDFRAGDASPVE